MHRANYELSHQVPVLRKRDNANGLYSLLDMGNIRPLNRYIRNSICIYIKNCGF